MGIKPFGRLVDQVLEQEPYHDADRLFFVVDNGSSHRGQTSVVRMCLRDKRIILVHTPVHASWLNQVEIYFSIIQRKVLTPNDFATLDAIRLRLALYEDRSNRTPRPFAWKFTRQDLLNWLKRASPHFLSSLGCLTSKTRLTATLICETDHLGCSAAVRKPAAERVLVTSSRYVGRHPCRTPQKILTLAVYLWRNAIAGFELSCQDRFLLYFSRVPRFIEHSTRCLIVGK